METTQSEVEQAGVVAESLTDVGNVGDAEGSSDKAKEQAEVVAESPRDAETPLVGNVGDAEESSGKVKEQAGVAAESSRDPETPLVGNVGDAEESSVKAKTTDSLKRKKSNVADSKNKNTDGTKAKKSKNISKIKGKKPRKKRARILPTATAIATPNDSMIVESEEQKNKEEEQKKPQENEETKVEVLKMSRFCTSFKAIKPAENATERTLKSTKNKRSNGVLNNEEIVEEQAGPAVQIINGEIVLQESSMILHGNVKLPTEEDDEYQVVEEEDQLGGIGSTYTSFSTKRVQSAMWTVEDTQLFYTCLRMVGMDFVTMEAFFTENKRTRMMLKRKYKKELIGNPHLIEAALKADARVPLDLSVFEVTADDVANVAKPTAPIHELNDSSETAAAAGKSLMNGLDLVFEEGTKQEELEVVTEDADQMPKVEAFSDSFWEQEKKEENPNVPKEEQVEEEVDPFLQEEQDIDIIDAPEPAAISLLSTAAGNKKKTKKPKFRSRKAKGK